MAPETELSITHAQGDRMQFRYTFHESVMTNFQLHSDVARKELTRRFPEKMSMIVDEMKAALENELPETTGNN
jgi:hypothetical protein